ncbi:MAG TPA: beta-phosphoglucomutase family hydrolase [Verrucomicrobiota bacterium]|nr:beta-phosphoglucomutase family hydrolase [Verrucomicrobiota bacterium]HNU50396.1 beta-phosphoglucomutase family hydrolase [Verrucomicrobiota bacterium]
MTASPAPAGKRSEEPLTRMSLPDVNPKQGGLGGPIPPEIRGLIFDFDGTLADTMPLHWEAWQRIAARHGFAFTERQFYALGGVPSRDIIRTLSAEQNIPLDPLAIAREKEDEYLVLLDRVQPIEPMVALARAQWGQRRMAVASGGSRRVISRVLGHLGLAPLFDALVTNEDVTRQKPAPDIFLEAARRIGVAPAGCRAYEDTDLGLQAIRAAGMEAVDVRLWLESGPRDSVVR